eukprot:s10988_g1.t1
MAKSMAKPETLFPDLNASEKPDWYRELWTKMGVRGAPIDQVDLQPMVESLRNEELQRYKESFEKLSCVYVDVSPGLNGLAVLAFVQYLKRKGLVVLILVSGHQDLGVLRMMDLLYALPILGVERCVKDELETTSHPCWVCRVLRMMDLLYALPILGVERCVKDELETTSHPCWVCRWKEHAQKGNVVFGTLVDKVMWMSELTCRTIKCDCSWHVASDYASRFNMNLPCILWEHIWKHLGENTQKLIEDERSIEQAVLAAVAVRDFEENKRKRREELDAAE